MDSDVKAHELPEFLILEAKLIGKVGTVVESCVTCGHGRIVAIFVCIDDGCDARDLGTEVQAILERRFPVLCLVYTALVCLHEVTLWLAGKNTHGELSHSVHITRERLNHSLFVSGELSSTEEILLEAGDLGFAWELACQEQPKDALGDGLSSWHGCRCFLPDLKELGATVRDTLCRVELRCLVEHAWDASHATDDLCNGDVVDDGVGVLLAERNHLLLSVSDDLLHSLTQDLRAESAAR